MAKKSGKQLPTVKKTGSFLSAEEDKITQKQADNLQYLVMAGTSPSGRRDQLGTAHTHPTDPMVPTAHGSHGSHSSRLPRVARLLFPWLAWFPWIAAPTALTGRTVKSLVGHAQRS